MPQNDIYNSERQYKTIVKRFATKYYDKKNKNIQYHLKNAKNRRYVKMLIKEFDLLDMSYIRRIQFLKAFRKICSRTNKDLAILTQPEIKTIITSLYTVHKSSNTRRDFINYGKAIWKILFPETDNQGRPDTTITPHPWRIKVYTDKSTQKDREDKLTDTEYIKIMRSLGRDPRMQTYFSLLFECLARPQELCYLKIKDVDVRDNYARIRVSEHGKEGTKTLQVIDGYYYLTTWLNTHPYKDDPQAPLFVTMGNRSRGKPLTPKHANKILQRKLKELKISKQLTNYSFKRNGVSARYISGDSPQAIQKVAGWTSTAQLKTYDITEQEDFLQEELVQKGILKPGKGKRKVVSYKICAFCNTINPKANTHCSTCSRPLDREAILKEEQERRSNDMDRMRELVVADVLRELREKGVPRR